MSNKKIVYILNSLLIGGIQRVVVENANGLDPKKYSVHIVSLSRVDPSNNIFNVIKLNSNITLYEIDFSFYSNYSLLGYLKVILKSKKSYSNIDDLIKIIHLIKPDIIHFHTSPRELVLKKFLNYTALYIFTDHTLRINQIEYGILKSKVLSLLFRKLYSGFLIIAVSDEIKRSLYLNKIIHPLLPIKVVNNGVNPENYKYRDVNKNKSSDFIVVYVSRIAHAKGHADLITAWASLKDIKNKKLYLIGADDLNGKMHQMAITLNCSNHIIFTGPVSKPELFLEKAKIAVFPSYKEGLPLALLEKMSAKLPVIVSSIPELMTIISHKKNGLIFELGNTIDLAQKIRFLYQNQILAEELGEQARATVEEKFNIHNSMKILNNFYEKSLVEKIKSS